MNISISLLTEITDVSKERDRQARALMLSKLLLDHGIVKLALPLARDGDQFVLCATGEVAVKGNSRLIAEVQTRKGVFFAVEHSSQLTDELRAIQMRSGISRHKKHLGVFSLCSRNTVEAVIIVEMPRGSGCMTLEDLRCLHGLMQLAHSFAENLYRVEREAADAWAVQRAYLPTQQPTIAGLDYECFIRPASAVGGDYYEVRFEDSHLAVFVVGDVVGKGAAAALAMSCITSHLRREIGKRLNNLTDLMSTLNSLAYSVAQRYTTLFILVIDLDIMSMRYVSAGHQPAVICARRDGTTEELTEGGPPIGLADPPFGEYTVGIVPANEGDFIVIATDGIADAQDTEGKFFDAEGLRNFILEREADQSCKQFVKALVASVDRFVGSNEQADDLTIIAIKVCATNQPLAS